MQELEENTVREQSSMDMEMATEAHVKPAPALVLEWYPLVSHCAQGP